MKFTHEITTIEADARELRESQSIGANMLAMLNRAFQSKEPLDALEPDEEDADD